MEYTKFSIRIPKVLIDTLDAEALKRFRNRNQLITDILVERYHSHAPPPTVSTQSQMADVGISRISRKDNTTN